jgi:hypothetical protein
MRMGLSTVFMIIRQRMLKTPSAETKIRILSTRAQRTFIPNLRATMESLYNERRDK